MCTNIHTLFYRGIKLVLTSVVLDQIYHNRPKKTLDNKVIMDKITREVDFNKLRGGEKMSLLSDMTKLKGVLSMTLTSDRVSVK